MLSRRWLPPDVVLAAAAVAALLVEGNLRANGGLSAGWYFLAIAAGAALAWRTRAPLLALVAVEAGALASAAAFSANWAALAVLLFQLYTVALLGDRQRSVFVAAFTAVAVAIAVLLIGDNTEVTAMALRVALVLAAVAIGDTVRSRRALSAAARDRADRELRERDEETRRRAEAERLRIARELHDTLAHSLVAINVRSSVALDPNVSQDPTAALGDIKQVSATALRDLRATLSLLRERGDAAPIAPVPALDGLPGLVNQARSAGLRADLDVRVDDVEIPSAIGGAAYRIVQEALTNVLRHANATTAQVSLRASLDVLDVEVIDDGRAGTSGGNPGLGLRGMAERAAALGGRFDAGPLEANGWCVRAVFPLRDGNVT